MSQNFQMSGKLHVPATRPQGEVSCVGLCCDRNIFDQTKAREAIFKIAYNIIFN
jgi:hypothetical protein